MTDAQKTALNLMAAENTGAILVKGYGWVWPHDIRDSEAVALAVIDRYAKESR